MQQPRTMTDETQAAMPVEDAPLSPPEAEVADSSPAQVETETQPDDAGQARDEDGKFLSEKAQKRIDHLTWEKNQREREAEYWRQRAMETQKAPEPPKPAQPVKLPTLEEVGYDEAKYQAALIEYATRQAEKVVEERLTQAERTRAEQARVETFAARTQAFAKATPDFEDRVLKDPTLPITESMRDVILDSESGPEIAYYLATNRAQAEQIARLPPHLAALEMGRIEGRLAAQKEAAKRPVVTKAPPPPPTVEETADASPPIKPDSPDSDALSDADWMRMRNSQIKRKKR